MVVCWHDERSSAEATREMQDLDEVRRLFARYRQIARMHTAPVPERPPITVEAEEEPDRTPVGAGV
jgi:hypothetical protein